MKIEISDPALVDDLVNFLCAMGYIAKGEGMATVTAFLPLAAEDSHQRKDAALLLRTWSARRDVQALIV